MKKGAVPIIDLHNDLLCYLNMKEGRSPRDPESRSSIDQMRAGNVLLQTLAIYSVSGNASVSQGQAQVALFEKLLSTYPETYGRAQFPLEMHVPKIHLLTSVENASSFISETEPLDTGIKRLEEGIARVGPLFYISMTWDDENRFGGGNRAPHAGLKEDGKRLLDWMHGKNIAIDFSHTSDRLAHGILEWIDQGSLKIPVMASHSNFRAVANQPRNLPEEIAKELIRRDGLIGLNFFAPFIHKTDPSALLRHVEYALSIGGENALSFGADFFCDADFSNLLEKYEVKQAYFSGYGTPADYPSILRELVDKLSLSEEQMLKISSMNALKFLESQVLAKV